MENENRGSWTVVGNMYNGFLVSCGKLLSVICVHPVINSCDD